MWEAIYHWILWRRFTLLALCLRQVTSRASTPLTFLLSQTFREVSSRDVRMVCPRPKSPPDEWSARRRGRYLHNTQQTQQTNIHPVCGIRTRELSNPAAADARFRRPSHWERFVTDIWVCNLMADVNQRQCHLLPWRAERHSIEMRTMHSTLLAAGGIRREGKLIHTQNFHLADLSSNPTFNSSCPLPSAPAPRPNRKPRRLGSYSRYIIV